MGCFDTGKLSESGTRNGSVTPVWVGALLVHFRFCRSNIMTVADTRWFAASIRARWSGIVAPLWHIWLPAAPLRQLASSYDHACKSSPALHLMHAWWIPDRVLGKWAFFMIFRLETIPKQYVRRYFLQVKKHTFKRIPGSHTSNKFYSVANTECYSCINPRATISSIHIDYSTASTGNDGVTKRRGFMLKSVITHRRTTHEGLKVPPNAPDV